MTTGPRRRTSWPLVIGAHLAVSVLLAFLVLRDHPFALSDVTLYFDWSGLVAQGGVPYRDFFFDYPPLALPALLLPRAAAGFTAITFGTYVVLFASLMALISLAGLYVARLAAKSLSMDDTRIIWHLFPLTLAMPLLLIRFEPWPLLLTALALLAAVRGSPAWSGAWLGLAIAAKLYPAAVLPAFGAYWLFTRGSRSAVIHGATAVLVAAAAILPFLALSGGGLLEMLSFQQGRGLQIETAAAGIIQLLNIASPERVEIVHVTTYELVSDAVAPYLAMQPMILVGAIGITGAMGVYRIRAAAGGPRVVEALAAISMALLIAFLLTNRALSPQHILWLLPFSWLLKGYRRLMVVAIVGLTVLVFPLMYEQLLGHEPVAIIALNVRNGLLAALAIAHLVPGQKRARGHGAPADASSRVADESTLAASSRHDVQSGGRSAAGTAPTMGTRPPIPSDKRYSV